MKHIVWLNLAWQWRYPTYKTGFLFIGTRCISPFFIFAFRSMVQDDLLLIDWGAHSSNSEKTSPSSDSTPVGHDVGHGQHGRRRCVDSVDHVDWRSCQADSIPVRFHTDGIPHDGKPVSSKSPLPPPNFFFFFLIIQNTKICHHHFVLFYNSSFLCLFVPLMGRFKSPQFLAIWKKEEIHGIQGENRIHKLHRKLI